jgi:hypothetical protein
MKEVTNILCFDNLPKIGSRLPQKDNLPQSKKLHGGECYHMKRKTCDMKSVSGMKKAECIGIAWDAVGNL